MCTVLLPPGVNTTAVNKYMYNIKMDLQKVECGSKDRIDLALDGDRWGLL